MFEAMAGSWAGTYRLWLEPGKLRTECDSTLRGEPVGGGRFVRAAYDWTDTGGDGGAQSGEFLLACPAADRWEVSWVDTWHSGDGIFLCTGPPGAVTTTYGEPDQQWGWRTEFELPEPDQLVIRAYNITPSGEEALATEADYRRAGK